MRTKILELRKSYAQTRYFNVTRYRYGSVLFLRFPKYLIFYYNCTDHFHNDVTSVPDP
jgi:hypothetical protein